VISFSLLLLLLPPLPLPLLVMMVEGSALVGVSALTIAGLV
jgi:hypothetical protein